MGISIGSVRNIVSRNSEVLANIKSQLIAHETKKAKKLLDRSHALIDKRLNSESIVYDNRETLHEKYEDGDISYREYMAGLRALPTLTLTELTSLSKEMFNQSQIEAGKPTSIPAGTQGLPKDAKARVNELLELMRDNDEITLLERMEDDISQ